jgi:hypothetical protein
MDQTQFLDLVEGAILAALEAEHIELTDEENEYMRKMLDKYGRRLQESQLEPKAAMDLLWKFWEGRVAEVKKNTEKGIFDGKLASVRLEAITDAISRHWSEIRNCGMISDAERSSEFSKFKA